VNLNASLCSALTQPVSQKKGINPIFTPISYRKKMNIADLKLDDQLELPIQGKGRISFIGDNYFGITFDDQNELLIRREELQNTLFGKTKPDEINNSLVKQTN
jgi:hypothetical protein